VVRFGLVLSRVLYVLEKLDCASTGKINFCTRHELIENNYVCHARTYYEILFSVLLSLEILKSTESLLVRNTKLQYCMFSSRLFLSVMIKLQGLPDSVKIKIQSGIVGSYCHIDTYNFEDPYH